jgi:calcineurin-like phosphoesterase
VSRWHGGQKRYYLREYLTDIPDWTKEAWEAPELQGVYLDIDKDGKARSTERVRIKTD